MDENEKNYSYMATYFWGRLSCSKAARRPEQHLRIRIVSAAWGIHPIGAAKPTAGVHSGSGR